MDRYEWKQRVHEMNCVMSDKTQSNQMKIKAKPLITKQNSGNKPRDNR